MGSTEIEERDQQLGQLFDAVAPEVRDRGFTDQAMRRIARLVWIRRLATTVALAVAVPLLVIVLAAVLVPAGALSSIEGAGPGGSAWDASAAVGVCLLLVVRAANAVRH